MVPDPRRHRNRRAHAPPPPYKLQNPYNYKQINLIYSIIKSYMKLNRIFEKSYLCLPSLTKLLCFDPRDTEAMKIVRFLQDSYYKYKSMQASSWSEDENRNLVRYIGDLKKIFRKRNVKKTFYYFIELVFIHMDSEILCRKFDFDCCESHEHNDKCVEKWENVKKYLQKYMFKDLGMEAWKPKEALSHENTQSLGVEDPKEKEALMTFSNFLFYSGQARVSLNN